LPEGWTWSGKRVLDFGCGAGRALRHFVSEAGDAEFWGCDIDAQSVAWINASLNPPLRAFVNDEQPPLPRPDDSFDLIYALSVFTHLTDTWSAWLLELHRVLAPRGTLIASFLGAGMIEAVADEPWSEDRIGMNVLNAGRSWDRGGPSVLLSPWWIREHWGQAFEIERIDDRPSRRRRVSLSRDRSRIHPAVPSSSASTPTTRARSRHCDTTSTSSAAKQHLPMPRSRAQSRATKAASAGV
jgi:SAM-dependent methyltransferase